MAFWLKISLIFIVLLGKKAISQGQSMDDAFMMNKHQICTGGLYTHNSYDYYWEGTLRRNNLNLGTVTTQSYTYMGIYGITNRLNILASLPYIATQSSAGTLRGMKGLQDIVISLKYQAYSYKSNFGKFKLFAIAGVSFPSNNYLADYLPLSIGLKSRTLSGRIMGDYQFHHFFFTGSYYYTFRSNIAIDRNAYYTTQLYLTDQVEMPNIDGFTLRSGYRSIHWVLEAILQNYNTLGGFDIRRNDNPFPSNRMNWNSLGTNIKYEFSKPFNGFTLYGGAAYVINGRNVGQSRIFDLGLFYAFYLSKKHTR